MVVVSRYSAGGDESDILNNKLGIIDPQELQQTEALLLRDAYDHFLKLLKENKLKLHLDLIFDLHEYFLGTLYTWAGKPRSVNISKNNAVFVPAQYIESALEQFQSDFEKHIPSIKDSKEETARKLALIHCELNVIHPFREGSGRTLRLFLDLLAMNAGFEPVDFTKISDEEYLEAC